MTKPSISAFFPCYNDAKSIGKLVLKADEVLKSAAGHYEIIVVNDGSRDESLAILQGLRKKVKALKIINHLKNRGYGGALKSGFAATKNDLIFYTDGDGQYDVSELSLLLDCLTPDIDVVNGIKIERKDDGIRVLAGNAYKSVVRNLFNLPVYDVDCDFRLIRRCYLEKVELTVDSGAICLELVSKLQKNGARFREVSVHHYPREFGSSQFFHWKPIIQTLFDLIRCYFSKNEKNRNSERQVNKTQQKSFHAAGKQKKGIY